MDKIEYLMRAEKYAETRGDEYYFKHYYSSCREYNDVVESVWLTLRWLYDEEVANLLKFQYWGPSL